MSPSCSARADLVHTDWDFCPSTPAAILFTVLFALTTAAHLWQAILYKKTYCWVIIGSGLVKTVNYIFRIISIRNPNSLGPYAVWYALILIAPLFTNAFVYMVLGRMVWNYVPDAKIYRITTWRFSTYFVILDIIAFIIQIVGAGSVAGSNEPSQRVLNGELTLYQDQKGFNLTTIPGIHIYMAGVAFQQFFIFVFSFFVIANPLNTDLTIL